MSWKQHQLMNWKRVGMVFRQYAEENPKVKKTVLTFRLVIRFSCFLAASYLCVMTALVAAEAQYRFLTGLFFLSFLLVAAEGIYAAVDIGRTWRKEVPDNA